MNESNQSIDLEESVVEIPLLPRRRNRVESNTSSGSNDVIIIDSPSEATNARATRRRRRAGSNSINEIVDLTCNTEVVDLTSADRSSSSRRTATERANTPRHRTQPHSRRVARPQPSAAVAQAMAPPQPLEEPRDQFQSLPEVHCPVCLESIKTILRQGNELNSTVCGHVFCRNCITLAIRSSHKCPTCRRKLVPKNVHPLYLSAT
uniref:RING-type domain-containing protein n=1 Tax=Ciona savignyi TaxID=51511 RepID=H2YHZ9_CIOSA